MPQAVSVMGVANSPQQSLQKEIYTYAAIHSQVSI